MRAQLVLALAVCFGATAAVFSQGKPVVFDWDIVPANGDDDFDAQYEKVKQKYAGKDVTIKGRFVLKATSEREQLGYLEVLVKRGEIQARRQITVAFRDKDPKKINEAGNKLATLTGKAEVDKFGRFQIQNCTLDRVEELPKEKPRKK
jgi:hypothetical protein